MSQTLWGDEQTQFFYELTPEKILDAIETLGLATTARVLILNSMENRVYEVEIEPIEEVLSESDRFVIAKFYRPGRWSREQIQDEHNFLFDLQEAEIPVIAPLKINNQSVFEFEGLFLTLFPKRGGRNIDEFSEDQIAILGRTIARIHNVGKTQTAPHRLNLTPEIYGLQNLKLIRSLDIIPPHLNSQYSDLVMNLVESMKPLFKNYSQQRIHGDCHIGNILWRSPYEPLFLDFDDMVMGPPVQDLWLAVPGNDPESLLLRNQLITYYSEFTEFQRDSLRLIEPLRTLRFIHFTAWIAKRYSDPSFQAAFPQFKHPNYWETSLGDLNNQKRLINEQAQNYENW